MEIAQLDKTLNMCKFVTTSLFGSSIFNLGPLEWLWRSLTNRKMQALRRTNSIPFL